MKNNTQTQSQIYVNGYKVKQPKSHLELKPTTKKY